MSDNSPDRPSDHPDAIIRRLTTELRDATLRTAVWSRGALPLPEPWRWDGSYLRRPDVVVWHGWDENPMGETWRSWCWTHADDNDGRAGSDPDPLVCLRAAEAWLAARGGSNAS